MNDKCLKSSQQILKLHLQSQWIPAKACLKPGWERVDHNGEKAKKTNFVTADAAEVAILLLEKKTKRTAAL